jgi:hypothetical protein
MGKTCSLHVTPPVEITPKTAAKFASLNSSIFRVGLCARAGACKPRKFRGSFVGYFDVPESENQRFIPQNLRFELWRSEVFPFR